jgi:hypothetical protein
MKKPDPDIAPIATAFFFDFAFLAINSADDLV